MPRIDKDTRLREMQDIAFARGGYCLSSRYIDSQSPLRWLCGEGHDWKSTPNNVKNRSTWCRRCYELSLIGHDPWEPLTLEEMQQIAIERGGYCLSRRYVNIHTPLRWMCSEGHIWEAEPNNVKNADNWCPICLFLTLKEMQDIATERGGYCLSSRYVNAHTPLRWMCGEGHVWKTTPDSVKYQGTWCSACEPRTLKEMQDIATERGGYCLSSRYINVNTPLYWMCSEGHGWQATPDSIKNKDTWCRECWHTCLRLSLKEMQDIATERGGYCLSFNYVNVHIPLRWICGEGHEWQATPDSIKYKGTWCRSCLGNGPPFVTTADARHCC